MSKKIKKFELEKKLQALKPKEFIYLLVTIPILFFVPYYNFIYPEMVKTNKKLIKTKKNKLSELSKVVSEIRKLKKSKLSIVPVSKKLENLKEDYRYIKYNYGTLTLLQLDNQRIYDITTAILKESKKYKMGLSIKFEWDKKPPKPFTRAINVEMEGKGKYLDIVNLIKYIETLNSILEIKEVNVKKENLKDTEINVNKNGELSINLEKCVSKIAHKFVENKSSLSFLLNDYTDDKIYALKEIAKSKKVQISFSQYENRGDVILVSFSGKYEDIRALFNQFKKNKKFSISQLKTNFVIPKEENPQDVIQYFKIKFNLVGVK